MAQAQASRLSRGWISPGPQPRARRGFCEVSRRGGSISTVPPHLPLPAPPAGRGLLSGRLRLAHAQRERNKRFCPRCGRAGRGQQEPSQQRRGFPKGAPDSGPWWAGPAVGGAPHRALPGLGCHRRSCEAPEGLLRQQMATAAVTSSLVPPAAPASRLFTTHVLSTA